MKMYWGGGIVPRILDLGTLSPESAVNTGLYVEYCFIIFISQKSV
jgi:hypothetical protein